jgi:hypothetical protein
VTTQAADAVAVLISSTSQLGTTSSSRRFKTDITPIPEEESQKIQQLNAVSFRYKEHPDNPRLDYGFIAEDVLDIFPHIVVNDKEGQIETIQYHKLFGLMIAEIQRLNRRIEALERK